MIDANQMPTAKDLACDDETTSLPALVGGTGVCIQRMLALPNVSDLDRRHLVACRHPAMCFRSSCPRKLGNELMGCPDPVKLVPMPYRLRP